MSADRIEVVTADITTLTVDVIVNAANESLLGGGGVDGAIHRAAGPRLLEECRTLRGCPTGGAKLTAGYELPAAHVIHTVGPIWGDQPDEESDELLTNAYRNSLVLAAEHGCRTVAFPNISTGVYGFPKDRAVGVAIDAVTASAGSIETITFVCFDDENLQLYRDRLS